MPDLTLSEPTEEQIRAILQDAIIRVYNDIGGIIRTEVIDHQSFKIIAKTAGDDVSFVVRVYKDGNIWVPVE